MTLGADYLGSGACRFTVWAPFRSSLEVRLLNDQERILPMSLDNRGYWRTEVEGVPPGSRYLYRLDGQEELPDPASDHQPDGVHGPSAVVDHSEQPWSDQGWQNLALEDCILYELHVGTFSLEGTFEAVIPRLDALKDLGINALNLMPVAQFPGARNWGYDGVAPFAVQASYGGPDGLKRLVEACHQRGLAVFLDVVYNHLGPEGNYLSRFGPYFTDTYKTPWGPAVNFDGSYSDEVRAYFLANVRHWYERYHLDGLRLDAVHAIFDLSAKPFLQEMSEAVEAMTKGGKPFHLIAESDLNDSKVIRPRASRGFGLQAQWTDDFHHALHSLLTGERRGYYADFGSVGDLEKSLTQAYVYDWRYSEHRKRRHGNSAADLPASCFVVFSQNHDQIGNRMLGERLSSLVSFEKLKLAAAAVILSPYIPLLFMGEEFGEEHPFLYFTSHGDQDLVQAVRKGRAEEFKAFAWSGEPPDPQSGETFRSSVLSWEKRSQGRHGSLLAFYRELIRLRRESPVMARPNRQGLKTECYEKDMTLLIHRGDTNERILLAFNFGAAPCSVSAGQGAPSWSKILDSAESAWAGPGSDIPEKLASRERFTLSPASAVLLRAQSG